MPRAEALISIMKLSPALHLSSPRFAGATLCTVSCGVWPQTDHQASQFQWRITQASGSHSIKKDRHSRICIYILMYSLPFHPHTMLQHILFQCHLGLCMQQSVYISKCMVYWRVRVRVRARGWSLEAVLAQHSDYSGILGHRQIRPIGKTTGEKQRKYHSVVLMKLHREERWLSDLTLRGSKTNPGKVRETKLEEIEFDSCDTEGRGGEGCVFVSELILLHVSRAAVW